MNSSHFARHRRAFLAAGAMAAGAPALSWAVQRQSLDDPMRLGVDDALMASGLARALQRAFGVDTGIAVSLNAASAIDMLEAAELGEQDTVLTNAPRLEAQIEKQGLVHDRRPIASGSLVLVGPKALAKPLADAKRDVVLALQRLAEVQTPFVSLGTGSGTQLAEQTLWRAAQLVPDKAWHESLAASPQALAQARDRQACMLVEQGAWLAQGGLAGYAVLVDSDPRLEMPVHVMRSFRVNHPAGKLFVNWIAGPKGRRVVAGQRGYRLA
jgi:tungstate transport system substrate-binding protein